MTTKLRIAKGACHRGRQRGERRIGEGGVGEGGVGEGGVGERRGKGGERRRAEREE